MIARNCTVCGEWDDRPGNPACSAPHPERFDLLVADYCRAAEARQEKARLDWVDNRRTFNAAACWARLDRRGLPIFRVPARTEPA
jgi:hypothetical protein